MELNSETTQSHSLLPAAGLFSLAHIQRKAATRATIVAA
jgi:hypothetical protein